MKRRKKFASKFRYLGAPERLVRRAFLSFFSSLEGHGSPSLVHVCLVSHGVWVVGNGEGQSVCNKGNNRRMQC